MHFNKGIRADQLSHFGFDAWSRSEDIHSRNSGYTRIWPDAAVEVLKLLSNFNPISISGVQTHKICSNLVSSVRATKVIALGRQVRTGSGSGWVGPMRSAECGMRISSDCDTRSEPGAVATGWAQCGLRSAECGFRPIATRVRTGRGSDWVGPMRTAECGMRISSDCNTSRHRER
jgi:hypothetical protein